MLPTGLVTFLMTDVEGSTRLWEAHPEEMVGVIERHTDIMEAAVGDRGVLIRSKGEGDSTFSVFVDATDALHAIVEAQRAIHAEEWPEGIELRVRAALYSGEAAIREGDYFGAAPNRCSRLRGVAHGGQTVCSETTADLIAGRCPPDVALHDLGLHRLRDIARAERIFQVGHPELPGDFPPLNSLGVRHNLPARRSTFVGREQDLIAVMKYLERDRLVTVTGIGGCGKTRLALEVASELLDGFPDGVFFADLSPVTDPHVVGGTVAAAVGFERMALGTGSGRPSGELVDFLSTREALLVIDNCEHVIDACAQLIDEILERCPGVLMLATSREALELDGERTYPLAPLTTPDDDMPEASDAVRLFEERAALARPDFVVSRDNVGDIAEICRRVDGLPLAIELAAAHVSHLAPRQILERLDDRFRLLAGGRRRTQRQQTLHATLEWGHDLLTDDERAAFRALAAFPGTFSFDAADAVCGGLPTLELLRSLVAKSLVVTEEEAERQRYRLLETVRVYADGKLHEAGEHELVRQRHRDFFLRWAEAIPTELTFLDPDGDIRRERHNMRAALLWSEQEDRPDLIGRLAGTMSSLWAADIRDGRRWLTRAAEAADELDYEARVRLLTVAAYVAVLAIQAQDGKLAEQAVEASDGRPGMWSSLAHSLLCLNRGIRFFISKTPSYAEEVRHLGQRAVELATEPISRGLAWFFYGQSLVLLDDYDDAIAGLEKGSREDVPGGDMSTISLAMVAGLQHIMGRHDEALATSEQVIERTRRHTTSGLWAWGVYSSLPYPLELAQRGRHQEAMAFMRDLLEQGPTLRTPGIMNSVIVVLAAMAALRGDDANARVLLEYVGAALFNGGLRTPIDLALLTHYQGIVNPKTDAQAGELRERGSSMSMDDAVALGLSS
ncbi:MAG TPA: LuxR family transcriptional regulator [Actinomycetota bacterium]|nr:LuxR family transcriptional regulator [Actinomycetota bacterium]